MSPGAPRFYVPGDSIALGCGSPSGFPVDGADVLVLQSEQSFRRIMPGKGME
ncbi:MAG: hypothetical protein ACO3ZG_08655 [Kiritimatiellia bacterium]